METKSIKCDDCKKKDCPYRIAGSVCVLNSQLAPLIKAAKTRDPILISQFITTIVGSEFDRYQKAKEAEDLGGESKQTIVDKSGNVRTITVKNRINSGVTNLAMNLVKSGKVLNDILNPPKTSPLLQQNNQYNIKMSTVDAIRDLKGDNKDKVIKFIDDKLDAKRSD